VYIPYAVYCGIWCVVHLRANLLPPSARWAQQGSSIMLWLNSVAADMQRIRFALECYWRHARSRARLGVPQRVLYSNMISLIALQCTQHCVEHILL